MQKLLVASAVLLAGTQADNKCRGVALRGGGDKGPYEVGVFKGLLEALPAEEIQYDVVAGVSVGSMIGGMLAGYPKGQEAEAIDKMVKMGSQLTSSNIWKNWFPFGVAEAITKPSLWDNSPYYDLIKNNMPNGLQRMAAFQTIDADTGKVYTFTEKEPLETQWLSIKASGSFPVGFPPQDYTDPQTGEVLHFVDGGIYSNTDIEQAILRCREKGFQDQDIIIDTILDQEDPSTLDTLSNEDVKKMNSKSVFWRMRAVRSYWKEIGDLLSIMRGYPNVDFRYLLQPSKKIPSELIPLFPTPEKDQFMINLGEQDAKNLVAAGPNARKLPNNIPK